MVASTAALTASDKMSENMSHLDLIWIHLLCNPPFAYNHEPTCREVRNQKLSGNLRRTPENNRPEFGETAGNRTAP